jgi:HEAT repeat protein
MLAMAAGLLAAVSGPAWAGEPPPKVDADLANLRDFLVGPDRTFGTRRDAADALLDKDTPQARAVLVEVLSSPMPSKVTLAALEAVSGREKAHEAFIEPLFLLLKHEDEAIRRAAAAAFGGFQGNDRVLGRLKSLAAAADTPQVQRLAAIQTLAHLIDKHSIEALVRLTGDAKATVAGAAAEALGDMTGLKDLGVSREAWQEWWRRHEQDPEALLLGGLLRRSRDESRRREVALDRIQVRLIRNLTDQYEAADAKQKIRLATEQLEDDLWQVRVLAARQTSVMARDVVGVGNGARQPYQDLIASLIKHVDDESPQVRAACADALASWKAPATGPMLLVRLNTEKSAEARAALAAALGSLKMAEAVPKLIAMLDSPNEVEVLRAAGALGAIGEKGLPGAAAVEPAVRTLGRLARSSASPAVREAACLATARIAPASAEDVLAGALEDAAPTVRFAAAQGLMNLGKAGERSVAALGARLSDDNKGVRQAVAAALAKLGGPEAARKMTDRLKAGAETEPAVRTSLWDAVKTLVDRAGAADVAQELGDRFFAREGVEDMLHAAALYEVALAKLPAADRSGPTGLTLSEKMVDAYLAAKMPDNAIPALRQLLSLTPAENAARVRELSQQLGLILLDKESAAEVVPTLAAALKGASAEEKQTILKALQARTDALVKADRPEQVMDLLTAFERAVPDWGGTEAAAKLKASSEQARAATVARAIVRLGGSEEQAAVATVALKKAGRLAVGKLLDALEAAAREKRGEQEARILGALEAVTGRKDHGYDTQGTLEDRLKQIAAWRGAV